MVQLTIVVNLKNSANCYRTAPKTFDVDLLKNLQEYRS